MSQRRTQKAEEERESSWGQGEERSAYTTCTFNCGSACVLKVRLQDGRVVGVEPDDSINQNVPREDMVLTPHALQNDHLQLRPCAKGLARGGYVYSEHRLAYPMRRSGARGTGQFERISWDDALDELAAKLRETQVQYGPHSIFAYAHGSGSLGLTNITASMAGTASRLLEAWLGDERVSSRCDASHWAHAFATAHLFGRPVSGGASPPGLLSSKLIVLWGWDPTSTLQGPLTPYYLALARERGARVISINPRYTMAEEVYADQWVPIKPGTDIALALALSHVIITEGLHDAGFIGQFVTGFEAYQNHLMGLDDGTPKTPEWAAPICGVPVETIRAMARLWGTVKPVWSYASWSMTRRDNGEMTALATMAIQVITGNGPGIVGGMAAPYVRAFETLATQGSGIGTAFKPVFTADVYEPPCTFKNWKWPDAVLLREQMRRGELSLTEFHRLIGLARDAPTPNIRLMITSGGNSINQVPNTNKAIEALRALDYYVVVEQMMTPTAAFADLLLPATTNWERADMPFLRVPQCFLYNRKLIEPQGEAKDDLWIWTEVAKRLGPEVLQRFNPWYIPGAEWDEMVDRLLREYYEAQVDRLAGVSSTALPDWDTFKEQGVARFDLPEPPVSFRSQIRDGEPFPTPSGKIELYSEKLAAITEDSKYGGTVHAGPTFKMPAESPETPGLEAFPLYADLVAHPRYRIHSSMQAHTAPYLRDAYQTALWLNVVDAATRGVRNGDVVEVSSPRGQLQVPAYVTERIMPGVVQLYEGNWYAPDESGDDLGGCSNVLTDDDFSVSGVWPVAGARVQVIRVEQKKR